MAAAQGQRIQSVGVNAPYGYSGSFSTPGTGWSQSYATWAAAMPSGLKTALLAAGFKDIRLYVDPIPFFTAANDAAIVALANAGPMVAVADLVAAGFNVTFDFHLQIAPSVPTGWGDTDVIAINTTGDTKFAKMVHCAVVLAPLLTPYQPHIRFEFFNEPPPPASFTGVTWITQLNYFYDQFRAVAPNMPVVVSPMNRGDIVCLVGGSGCPVFDPSHFDANTIVSIHDYEPGAFSAQDIGVRPYQYINRLNFPPGTGGQTASSTEASADAYITADTSLTAPQQAFQSTSVHSILDFYFNNPDDIAFLQNRLTFMATWADAHNVQRWNMLLGEFGCVGDPSADNPRSYISPPSGGLGADATNRATYYHTVAALMRSLNIGFSVHVLEADYREITDGSQNLVSTITTALFGP